MNGSGFCLYTRQSDGPELAREIQRRQVFSVEGALSKRKGKAYLAVNDGHIDNLSRISLATPLAIVF